MRDSGAIAGLIRGFWPLWLGSVVLPGLVFLAAAWWSWGLVQTEARTRLMRTVDMLHEHALRVFESQQALLTAIHGHTAAMTWQEIAASDDVSAFLRSLDRSTPGTNALGIVAPDGRLVHNSKAPFPVPVIDLSDRDYVVRQRGADAGPVVGEVIIGRVSSEAVFPVSHPRRGPDGRPDGGALWATFTVSKFTSFYGSIVESPRDSVLLLRADGAILASYPALLPATGQWLAADSVILELIRDAEMMPTRHAVSDLGLHGARRIGALPVAIAYSKPWHTIRTTWLRDLTAMGAVTLVAMLLLLSLTWFAAARARREQDALRQARLEAERRAETEAVLRRGQGLEILGQVVAGVAHDFRNVVQGVQGAAELGRSALDKGNTARAASMLDMIVESAGRAQSLINRMLRMAKAPGAAVSGDAASASLAPLAAVEATAELLRRTIGSGYAVRLDTAEGGLPRAARGDQAELEAALLNLAINARDAMPDGGEIRITLASEQVTSAQPPEVEGLRPGHYVRIMVADDGIGMDAETLARVGQAFFTTKAARGGTGLGLATVRAFVVNAGGALKVDSPGPGHGSSVTLWLPATDVAPEA